MMAFPCSGGASVIVCHGAIYSEAQCSIAVVTEFTVAAARTRRRLQLASCNPNGPIRGSIEQDGLDPYAQAGFDDEYASQTQKLDCWPRSSTLGGPALRTVVRHLVPIIMVALASMAAVTIATPAVSSAQCADGEWWDPTGKVCRPLGVGPQPLACEPGQWWDPTANVWRPLGVGPQPLACDNGWWWDPAANVCRPPPVPPPG